MTVKVPDRWTTEEDLRLLELKAAGKVVASIAKIMRRTESAVTMRLVVLKQRAKHKGADHH